MKNIFLLPLFVAIFINTSAQKTTNSEVSSQLKGYEYSAKLAVNLGPDISICFMFPVKLDAGFCEEATYKWSTGATSQTIEVDAAGVYSVIVTTNDGIGSDEINVYTSLISGGKIGYSQSDSFGFDPAPITSLSPPEAKAEVIEYRWQYSVNNILFNDIPNTNSLSYDPGFIEQTTWYRRLAHIDCMEDCDCIYDWTNAVSSNVVEMNVINDADVNAGPDAKIYKGYPPYSVKLNAVAKGSGTYSWSPGAGLSDPTIQNPIASPKSSTAYIVTFKNVKGVVKSDEVMVDVEDVRCGKNLDKVTICHAPNDKNGNAKSLCVGYTDVAEHLRHGDYLGNCVTKTQTNENGSPWMKIDDDLTVNVSPNPFVGNCEIEILANESSYTIIQVYDILGRSIATVFKGNLDQGFHSFSWEAPFSKGIDSFYYIVVRTPSDIKTIKLISKDF